MNVPEDRIAVVDPCRAAARFGSEARRLGLAPYAILSSGDLPHYHLNTFRPADFEEVHRHSDLESTVRWLKERKVRAVVPGAQLGLRLADQLADRLDLPGNPLASAPARLDKALMKQRLREQGIPCAAFTEGDQLRELQRWSEAHGYPVVAKPPEGAGTRGVRVCHDPRQLAAAFAQIMDLPALFHGAHRRVVVEEYLDGDEYFMDLVHDGDRHQVIACARYEKIQTEDSAGIYRNIFSLPLDAPEVEEAYGYVRRVSAALDVRLGVSDVEYKLTSKGPRFIELNNRLPGAMVPDMIQRCTGFNCYAEDLRLFLGEPAPAAVPVRYHRHYCVCCLISEGSGELAAVEGLRQVRRLASLDGVHIYQKVGEPIERTTDLTSTWGLVTLIHEDRQVLRHDADLVHRTLRPVIRNHGPSRREL
jgi:biotin carboxylase